MDRCCGNGALDGVRDGLPLRLLFALVVGPLTLLGVLRFVVVTVGMAAISFGLFRGHWLV